MSNESNFSDPLKAFINQLIVLYLEYHQIWGQTLVADQVGICDRALVTLTGLMHAYTEYPWRNSLRYQCFYETLVNASLEDFITVIDSPTKYCIVDSNRAKSLWISLFRLMSYELESYHRYEHLDHFSGHVLFQVIMRHIQVIGDMHRGVPPGFDAVNQLAIQHQREKLQELRNEKKLAEMHLKDTLVEDVEFEDVLQPESK